MASETVVQRDSDQAVAGSSQGNGQEADQGQEGDSEGAVEVVEAGNGGDTSGDRRPWVRHITEVAIANKIKVKVGERVKAIKEATGWCETAWLNARQVGEKKRDDTEDRGSCEGER